MRVGRIGVAAGLDLTSLVQARALRLLGGGESLGCFAVAPGQLATAIDGLVSLGFRGVSVAPAHQREAVELGDQVSPAAQLLGRATFLHFDGAGIHAENHEPEVLRSRLGQHPLPDQAAVLGSGVACGAAVAALAGLGVRSIVVHAADRSGATRLLHRLEGAFPRAALRLAEPGVAVAGGLVVHAGDAPAAVLAPQSVGYLLDLELAPSGLLPAFREAGGRGEDGVAALVESALAMVGRWRGEPVPATFAARLAAVVRAGGAGCVRASA